MNDRSNLPEEIRAVRLAIKNALAIGVPLETDQVVAMVAQLRGCEDAAYELTISHDHLDSMLAASAHALGSISALASSPINAATKRAALAERIH